MLTVTSFQFNAKQARREAQKAAKQDNELKKQIQGVRYLAHLPPSPPCRNVPALTKTDRRISLHDSSPIHVIHTCIAETPADGVEQLLKKGETQQAYQKARMLLAKQAIAAQMDQAADMAELSVAQIQANNAMNRMTHMMAQSSRTMSRAQKQVNPEKVRPPPPPSFPLSQLFSRPSHQKRPRLTGS